MTSKEGGDEIIKKFNLQGTDNNNESKYENYSPDCISLRY